MPDVELLATGEGDYRLHDPDALRAWMRDRSRRDFVDERTTAAEAVQKTVMFSIPLVQLSGFAFPIRSMPTVLQWITEVFPATHYIRVTRAIYIRAADVASLVPELLWLALFAALLAWLAVRTVEARA